MKNSKRKSDKKKKKKSKKEIKSMKETEHEVVKTVRKQLRRHYQGKQVNHTEALMNELKAKTSSMYTGHHRITTADSVNHGITIIDEEEKVSLPLRPFLNQPASRMQSYRLKRKKKVT
jgi:hypothetical protein